MDPGSEVIRAILRTSRSAWVDAPLMATGRYPRRNPVLNDEAEGCEVSRYIMRWEVPIAAPTATR